jgi:hypothetical protein
LSLILKALLYAYLIVHYVYMNWTDNLVALGVTFLITLVNPIWVEYR